MSDRVYIDKKFASSGMISLPHQMPHEHVEILMIKAMRTFGVNPAAIYAYEKTLYWVTEDNYKTLSKKIIAQWDKALDDFKGLIEKPSD